MNPEVLACPHAFNERLRQEAPVYQCPHTGITFVSDYETITRIAKDHETFSNRFSTAMPTSESKVDPRIVEIQKKGYPPVDTMLTQDPPVHRRYRGMVNQAFTARRVATLEPYIEQALSRADRRLRGRWPLRVRGRLCRAGAADGDRRSARRAAFRLRAVQVLVGRVCGSAVADGLTGRSRGGCPTHPTSTRTTSRRRSKSGGNIPQDDIISDIVHAQFENERPLDVPEMLSIIQQLLVAGNETTTHSIAEGVLLLIQHTDQHALLKDRSRI